MEITKPKVNKPKMKWIIETNKNPVKPSNSQTE